MKTWALILAAGLTVPGVALAQEGDTGTPQGTAPASVEEDTTPEVVQGEGQAEAISVLADDTAVPDETAPHTPGDMDEADKPPMTAREEEVAADADEVTGDAEEVAAGAADVAGDAAEVAADAEEMDAPAEEMAEDAATSQAPADGQAEADDAAPAETPADDRAEAQGSAPGADTPAPVATADEATTSVAPEASEPIAEAEPEAEPQPDPLLLAAQACLDIAGAPDAGVPAAKVDAAAQKEMLARAAQDCTKAAMAEDADPAVLFHAAAIAQARGNPAQTFALLTRAAQGGLGAAETRLGDYFLFGVGPQGQDIQTAVGHYQTAATLGDAAGMTTLALLYQVARGVPRDTGRMVELMTTAADQGYHFAQYRLAQTYMRGEGIPGRTDAGLGIPDPAKAVTYYTMAARAGNLSAALELATLYDDPNAGLPEDPEAQLDLLRIVAAEGHAPAIARIGTFYEMGRGVTYNPSVAAAIYVRALETGEVSVDEVRTGAPAAWDRETALAFQAILKDRGLYDGALDAMVGPGTRRAAAALAAN